MAPNHRADIEGLRALAIVPVVTFHAFPGLLPGGFVGVDVFFVISGFLITTLLLKRLDDGRYGIADFYAARVRRIFPALFAMLLLVVPAALWWLPPSGLSEFARILGATALFVSNHALHAGTGYFEAATELKPLVHTWSLAVEEQYYILFPLLLAFVHARGPRVRMAVLLALAAASLLYSALLVRQAPSAAYYWAASRAFELMIGSLLAAWQPGRPQVSSATRQAVAGAGLAAVVAACMFVDKASRFPAPAALMPCLGTAAMIWAGGQGPTPVGAWLSRPAMRWLGGVSFSLYLWHWPLLVFLNHATFGDPAAWQRVAVVAASVVLAWASLRWIEAPVRRSALGTPALLAFGGGGIGVALGLAAVLELRPHWLRQDAAAAQVLYAGALDFHPERRRCHGSDRREVAYEDRCTVGAPGAGRPDVAVWGDSHGVELAHALGTALAERGGAVAQMTSSTCPPAVGHEVPGWPRCAALNRRVLADLVGDPAVKQVVLAARHEHYLAQGAASYERGLMQTTLALTRAGKSVVLVGPVPTYAYPVPVALGALTRRGRDPQAFGQSRARYLELQAEGIGVVERVAGASGASILPTGDLLCPGDVCAVVDSGRPLYFDDNHLSLHGAMVLMRRWHQAQPVR